MKFIDGEAEIPDELVEAVLSGDAVFLCGAGISKGADLPLFNELTLKIYEDLGEAYENDPAELDSFRKNEFDRTLRALEKRVRRPGSERSPVRTSCAKHLQVPPLLRFPHHEAVLALSRDREGRSRVLTTNFDTLFERAAKDRKEEWRSEAVKGLPKPGGPRDYGIHHLHGRIADSALELPETELILTSADFGDAYLRDGWASRYVEDRMRTATLVLVGYRAEDAALRLLLETLDVDRERFPDLKKVYALERGTPGSAAQWRAKGVIPVEFVSHEALYDTLQVWGNYAERPLEFERDIITRVFRKLPSDASDFDKSQLSSLRGRGSVPALLITANPSLAWLPTLIELDVIRYDDRWSAGWLRQNLHEARSIVEVVSQLRMFGPSLADALSYNLEQYQGNLPPLLRKSWALLVRHMRQVKRSHVSAWYDLLPVLKRLDTSTETIERLTGILRPEIRISQHFTLSDEVNDTPNSVHDLMRVEYEPEDDVAVDEVLDAWSTQHAGEVDADLLNSLTHALDRAVADAADVGLDGNRGFGVVDMHVASVADHPQNRYRKGFLPIVRVIAEVWLRLATKRPALAVEFVSRWLRSPYLINRRLAMFAARHPAIDAILVKEVLLTLPAGELFLTGAAVEVHRLLVDRWTDLDTNTRLVIEQRLREGPPPEWFRIDADVSLYVDRSRYDVIGNLIRDGVALSQETRYECASIETRHPEWRLRPQAQAGFHRWFEMSSGVSSDELEEFVGVPDSELLTVALQEHAGGRVQEGESWRHVCERDPDRALRALANDAAMDRWKAGAWKAFLLSITKEKILTDVLKVGDLLMQWPEENLGEISGYAADWLGTPQLLNGGAYRWDLWDKLITIKVDDAPVALSAEAVVQESFGHPVSKLAEILVQLMPVAETDPLFSDEIEPRLAALIDMTGRVGQFARIRLSIEVNFIFERAPIWATAKLVPLFAWSSPDAPAVWTARQYARHIGGGALFNVTKAAFLGLFSRADVSDEVLRTFAGWMIAMLLSNQSGGGGFDLSFIEARAALRQTRATVLQSVAHELAVEMQRATPPQKTAVWRNSVGPVFEGVWPMDVDLLSGAVTFKLLQILRATGEAFLEAAVVIEPFIVPEDKEQGTATYSLANADEILFSSAPSKMLDIVAAVVGKKAPGSVFELQKILDRITAYEAGLIDTRKYQGLRQMAR
ncbi:SIR2 family protein (plasmid) [Agrobacterium sp. rho-8.1]|nr:SIR2 family protein [Agrobacterium sp. rho-8.1]